MNIHTLFAAALIVALAGCQGGKKMNPKDFTSVNVIRQSPLPPSASTESTAMPAPGANDKAATSDADATSEGNTPATSIPKDTLRKSLAPAEKYYHIIVASYPDLPPAESKVKRLKTDGFAEASIIHKDNRYRVSIAHFPAKQDAIDERARLSRLLGQEDIWIGRY